MCGPWWTDPHDTAGPARHRCMAVPAGGGGVGRAAGGCAGAVGGSCERVGLGVWWGRVAGSFGGARRCEAVAGALQGGCVACRVSAWRRRTWSVPASGGVGLLRWGRGAAPLGEGGPLRWGRPGGRGVLGGCMAERCIVVGVGVRGFGYKRSLVEGLAIWCELGVQIYIGAKGVRRPLAPGGWAV